LTTTVETRIHGRYAWRPAVAPPPRGLLVGFHGYAQHAESFLADLDAIPGAAAWKTVSVQGLHRFYNRSGQVVASWMTSQDRELAIADNLAYVRAVVDRVRAEAAAEAGASAPPRPLVFAGFSQGVAMAFRAAAHVPGCAGVIALGGDVPPEVRAASARLPPVLLGRGLDDEWYPREKFETDVAWFAATGIDATICEFDGGHVWTEAFRAAAATFLSRLGR
jgi:predicted esterase